MTQIKTANQLAKACKELAQCYDTLYVLGCIGAPMTERSKNRWLDAQAYNRKPERKKKILAATANTFGFDCVCMIKSLLWGFCGDSAKPYGGAVYKSGGVPDVNADGMIALCKEVSADFSHLEVGEALWMKGHIGVYIGDGLAVECTPRWADGVQITAVHNMGKKAGYNGRSWTKHGKLPWVTYGASAPVKNDYAKSRDKSLAGIYRVESAIGLKLRSGANTQKPILETMPDKALVRCYGYHTGNWLYVVSPSGREGFCFKGYLWKVTDHE